MTESLPPLPLIVLAGSNRDPAVLPASGADKRPLVGSKGVDVKIAGRPLIDHLLDRLEACGGFAPIVIAGPARVYGTSWRGHEVIDTDGSFGENVKTSLLALHARLPESPVVFTTCDIVPEVAELRRVLSDYHRHAPTDFWYPLILAPERSESLGASGWKPRYRIAPEPGAAGRVVLPGHLLLVDPARFHQELIFRSFDVAYRTRNRHILYRWLRMSASTLAVLLAADLRRLLRLRPPIRTLGSIWHGFMIGRRVSTGVISRQELEDRLWRIFFRPSVRRGQVDRRGRMPLVEGLSLAKDIDTLEEAEEQARRLEGLAG